MLSFMVAPNPDGVKISDITGVRVRNAKGQIRDNFPLPFVRGTQREGENKRKPLNSTAQLVGWITHSMRLSRVSHYARIGETLEIVAKVDGKNRVVAKAKMVTEDGINRSVKVMQAFPGLTL